MAKQQQHRITGTVLNANKEPLGESIKVSLLENGKTVKSNWCKSDGSFSILYPMTEVGFAYELVVDPRSEYLSPGPQPLELREGQREVKVDIVCSPASAQQEPAEDVAGKKESIGQAGFSYEWLRQQLTGDTDANSSSSDRTREERLPGVKEFIATKAKSFLLETLEELQAIPESCHLCSSLKDLTSEGAWPDAEVCVDQDESTQNGFVENIREQMGLLVEQCDAAAEALKKELAGEILGLTLEMLSQIADRYKDRIADVMTDYKALYDLILIESDSRQLPSNFLEHDNLKEKLAEPFECHQCMQASLAKIIAKIKRGPVGECLNDLADACEEIIQTSKAYHDNLMDIARSTAPDAATKYGNGLAELVEDLEKTCADVERLAQGYKNGVNIIDSLSKIMTNIRQDKDKAIALTTELLEAIRRQQFLPSWSERAVWLAEAKKGLQELWDGLTNLTKEIQTCLELAETLSDQEKMSLISLLQYIKNNPGALTTDYVYAAVVGALSNVAEMFQSGFTQLKGETNGAPVAKALQELNANVEDIAAHIPLNGGYSDGGGSGGIGGWDATRRAQKAVTNVIGGYKGPLGFRAALERTFLEDPKTGKINPTPSRSVVNLSIGKGQLAAGQGTLGHETQVIVEDAVKVLNGLKPICPNMTKEGLVEALTEMVRIDFESLLQEAHRIDRPRVSRVEEILDQLMAPRTASMPVGGHLLQLREALCLNSDGDLLTNPNLVTSEETQQLANMDLLDQYAITLENTFNRYFNTGAGRDPRNSSFSGRLAFVSTLFTVVASSVREVAADMDAVGFSEAERRTTFIVDPTVSGTTFLISIDGILTWIEDFAAQEGPDLTDRGGRIGLNHGLDIVNNRLTPMVEELVLISLGESNLNPTAPHPGLRHGRVRNALEQLLYQLYQFDPSGRFRRRGQSRPVIPRRAPVINIQEPSEPIQGFRLREAFLPDSEK